MPGQYYIYVPYTQDEYNKDLVTAANTWRSNMGSYMNGVITPEKRKAPKVIERQRNVNTLSILQGFAPEDYTLYIMAHCNVGRKHISNINFIGVAGRLELSAQQLTLRMQEDGLPRNIKNLKLFACNGGLADPSVTGSALDSYGARLYWSLITRGFDSVQLTAYTVPLKGPTVDQLTGHKQTQQGDRPSLHKRSWPN